MNAQLSRITKGALIMIAWMCLSWPRDFLGLTTVPDAEAFTVTKTYTFDASLESYSATCGTNVTCARSTADGSPGTVDDEDVGVIVLSFFHDKQKKYFSGGAARSRQNYHRSTTRQSDTSSFL